MANLSIDDQLSVRVLGTDNQLAPFFKSVSCLALLVLWGVDVCVAFRTYGRWQIEGVFFYYLLLAVATATVVLVYLYRRRLAASVAAQRFGDPSLDTFRSLSFGMTRLAGLLLLVVLFALSR